MKSSKALFSIFTIFLGLCCCLNAQAQVVLHTGTCTYDDSGKRTFVWCTSDDRGTVAPYTSFIGTQNILVEKIPNENIVLSAAYGKFADKSVWQLLKRDNVWTLEVSLPDNKITLEKSINMSTCVSNPPIHVEEAFVTNKTCQQWVERKLGNN